MGRITKAIQALAGVKTVTTTDDWLGPMVTVSDITGRRRSSVSSSMELVARATGMVAVYAAMNATACSSQRMRLYRAVASDPNAVPKHRRKAWEAGRAGVKAADFASRGGDVVEITDHPVLDFLDCPNINWPGGSSLVYQKFWFREVAGQSFSGIERDASGPVAEWPLYPQHVTVQPDEQSLIGGYWFGRGSEDVRKFEREDIIHLQHSPSPVNPYNGIGPLAFVVAEADLIAANLTHDQEFVSRGMRPDYVVTVDEKTSPTQIEEIRLTLRKLLGGLRGSTEPLILRNGSTVTAPQFSARELQDLEKRQELRQVLRTAFGIPESMEALNDANLASSEQGYGVQYLDLTVRPRVNRDADQQSEMLLPMFGLDPSIYRFMYDDPVPQNEERRTTLAAQRVSAGLTSINEERMEMGLEPVDGGDALRISGQSLETLDRAPEPAPAMGSGFGSIPISGFLAAPEPDGKGVVEVGGVVSERKGSEIGVTERKDAQTDDPWGSPCCDHEGEKAADGPFRSDKIQKLEKELVGTIRDNLTDIQGRAVAGEPVGKDDVDQIARLLRETLKGFAEVGLELAAEEAGGAFDIVPERALAFLDAYSLRLAGDIVETTLERTRASLATGLEEGESIDDIAKRLDDFTEARAETIARTEVQTAVQGGKLAGFEDIGITGKIWQLAPGGCPICKRIVDENDGTGQKSGVVSTQVPFWPAGVPIVGADGSTFTPRGPVLAPPAHPNCFVPDTRVGRIGTFAGMRAAYSGPVVDLETASGRRLTVTPEHPILTAGGFVPAGQINDGEDLVCGSLGHWPGGAGVAPDDDHAPTTIAEVFDSLSVSLGVSAATVPVAPEDLHGDAVFTEGQIDVVAIDCLLGDRINAPLAEMGEQLGLLGAVGLADSLASEGNQASMLIALRLAADGGVGLLGQSGPFVGRRLGHAGIHRLAAVAGGDAGQPQVLADRDAGDPAFLGHLLDRLSRVVTLDPLVHKSIRHYSGHVYDLSTESGLIVADGIVASNCRCNLLGDFGGDE